MFGLTIEKLFVVAVLAAIVIGPQRLPDCAAWLGALVRRMTLLAVDARQRVTRRNIESRHERNGMVDDAIPSQIPPGRCQRGIPR